MRELLAKISLIFLSFVWLGVGASLLFPTLGWFLLVVPPCLTGIGCGDVAVHINEALLFGRADPTQLRDALFWLAILTVWLTLMSLFLGIRLWGFVIYRHPYTFPRVASAYGVIVSTAILLLLAQSGLMESWLNWAVAGCPDENTILLCNATPAFPESHRLFLVEQYISLLGYIRFWGSFGAVLVFGCSLLLLWLPTVPTQAVMRNLMRASSVSAPACRWCGVRGEYRDGHRMPPACVLCESKLNSNDAQPSSSRRWPWQRNALILLMVLFSARMVSGQADEPIIWQQPDDFCAGADVRCLALFADSGTPDGISDLRINSLSDTSAQPVLEISFNINESLFIDEVVKVRIHLPSFHERIPTLTVPGSCELVIAALSPTPDVGTTDAVVLAQPYVEFTAEQAGSIGNRSLRAFAYCSRINLPGSNNPGFPASSTAAEPLFMQVHTDHQDRLSEVLPTLRGRLATVFERLQFGACSNSTDEAPLTFNSLGAQMAVFIAQEIVEGENWQEQVWERYHTLQPFTDNYAGLYCLLKRTRPSPEAALTDFPADGDELQVGSLVPLIDGSTGDILTRHLVITRGGISIYAEDHIPIGEVYKLDTPGEYNFAYTVSGLPSTYWNERVINNTPSVFSRTLHVLAVGGTPEPTPVGFLDQPVFSSQSLNLPVLNEDMLTLNQAVSLTFGSLILAGVGWGLLLYLPRTMRRLISLVLIAAILVAIALWIISRL